MPDFDSIPAFNSHLERFTTELADDMLRRVGKEVGKRAVDIADSEASRDLGGDRKFRNWAPVAETRAVQLAPGVVSIRPTKRSAGVWTVATVGRHPGGGKPGPKLTKSGKVSKAKGKRWNGTTRGMGTADRATARMEPIVEQVAQAEVVKTIGRFFD